VVYKPVHVTIRGKTERCETDDQIGREANSNVRDSRVESAHQHDSGRRVIREPETAAIRHNLVAK